MGVNMSIPAAYDECLSQTEQLEWLYKHKENLLTAGANIKITRSGDTVIIAAEGEGFSPTVSVETIPGGHRVTITDGEGPHVFDVMDGAPGQDGRNVFIKYADAQPTQDSDMKDLPSAFMGVYSGTATTAPTTFTDYLWYQIKGTKGDTGSQGPAGVSPSLSAEPISGGHRVSMTDAEGTTTFDVMDGENAAAATVTVGSTTTGEPGTNASVTNSGTSSDAVLDFVIPRGLQGPAGQGVPAGGTAGQVLKKASGTDYDTEWGNAASGAIDGVISDEVHVYGVKSDGTTTAAFTEVSGSTEYPTVSCIPLSTGSSNTNALKLAICGGLKNLSVGTTALTLKGLHIEIGDSTNDLTYTKDGTTYTVPSGGYAEYSSGSSSLNIPNPNLAPKAEIGKCMFSGYNGSTSVKVGGKYTIYVKSKVLCIDIDFDAETTLMDYSSWMGSYNGVYDCEFNVVVNGEAYPAPTNELPVIASGDAGKVLKVNSGETGVEWGAASGGGSSKNTLLALKCDNSGSDLFSNYTANLYNSRGYTTPISGCSIASGSVNTYIRETLKTFQTFNGNVMVTDGNAITPLNASFSATFSSSGTFSTQYNLVLGVDTQYGWCVCKEDGTTDSPDFMNVINGYGFCVIKHKQGGNVTETIFAPATFGYSNGRVTYTLDSSALGNKQYSPSDSYDFTFYGLG